MSTPTLKTRYWVLDLLYFQRRNIWNESGHPINTLVKHISDMTVHCAKKSIVNDTFPRPLGQKEFNLKVQLYFFHLAPYHHCHILYMQICEVYWKARLKKSITIEIHLRKWESCSKHLFLRHFGQKGMSTQTRLLSWWWWKLLDMYRVFVINRYIKKRHISAPGCHRKLNKQPFYS